MNNIYYELAQTQLALDAAQKVIRRQKGKLFGKNLLLVGTIGLFWTACKMLDESEKKRKAEKERADAAETELAEMLGEKVVPRDKLAEMQFEKDICCDGKASVTKKDV